jgi:sec-independent protein translocase protein TatA
MHVPLAFQMPGFGEMLLIAAIGLLIFGKRLPEVGKSLGKGIVEFKKGLKGIEDDVEVASNQPSPQQRAQLQQPPPHKFDPYTGKPIEQNANVTSTPPGAA